ncbi:hypothetical protein HZP85_13935 [Elizabethkingia anophelis]|nr:hypothetical protein [Elizabethkingia anophelis]
MKLARSFSEFEKLFIVDSMPIEKCKLTCSVTHIELETPKRVNQKDYKPQFYLFKKKRKKIETLFSQLYDLFMIRRNYAKNFEGFKSRLFQSKYQ